MQSIKKSRPQTWTRSGRHSSWDSRKKPEPFQYIPPRAPRKEAAQENATKGAASTEWTAEEWTMIQKAQAALEERRRQLEAEEAKGAIR